MAFTSKQLREFSEIISTEAPIGMLLDLRHPGIPLAIDDWRKERISDPDGGRMEIAKRVVAAYADRDSIPLLATSIYRRLYRDDIAAARLIPFTEDPGALSTEQQAALGIRANTMNFAALRHFWNEAAPRVCLVVASGPGTASNLGTGFLVGPDLIITAYHTLEKHIRDGDEVVPAPGPCHAVFDFYDGPPISTNSLGGPARWVKFADEWLEASRPGFKRDGTIRNPTPETIKRLQERLDFALVRLSEPIGLESYALDGGRKRGWFDVGRDLAKLQPGQRITIPQHPVGFPQKVDIGLFDEECPSGTRLRSLIETAPGSSGAPCFKISDDRFPLVGMHNARYAPRVRNGKPAPAVANQAIRIDHIAKLIDNVLKKLPELKAAKLWSVTPSGQPPRPILGRDQLIQWIGESARSSENPYFAAVGQNPKSGRNFSVEILRAARRDSGDRIVELGTRGYALPDTVPGLLRTVVDQLLMPASVLDGIPQRPARDSTDVADKLDKWASEAVPQWFELQLREHRQREVDARELAKMRIELAKASNVVVSPEDVALANLPDKQPLIQTRWDLIWFAIRLTNPSDEENAQDLPTDGLRSEVSAFLAGMMKGHPGGSAATGEFARLRWLFLGRAPDFLANIDPSRLERLDPMAIGEDDYVEAAKAIAQSLGGVLPPEAVPWARASVAPFLAVAEEFRTPEKRLEALQKVVVHFKPVIEADTQR